MLFSLNKNFKCTFQESLVPEKLWEETHVGGFLVVVNLVDSSGQAKVGDLHHVVLGNQNIPGCQISVDALQRGRHKKST